MKVLIVSLLGLLFPMAAGAHEGHATYGSLLHEFEHAAWAILAVLVAILAYTWLARSKRHNKDR